MTKTLIVLKPDSVQRQLVGEIIARFERKGLKIVALKMLRLSLQRAQRMYAVHEGKEFHARLVEFMTAAPVVAMVAVGKEVIHVVRDMVGPTFGPDAPGGTIRGDFGMSRRYNLIHASDSPESADYEIPIFFDDDEIQDYHLDGEHWIYAEQEGEKI